MAHRKVGSKAPVFVTHLEFVGTECHIFCQVGDVGGQADTIAERVNESVENGLASPVSKLNVGDLCLALFHEDHSWYRGRVCKNLGSSLTVYFIDYGNTETVNINNIREAPDYVLAIPALSTKCIVSDCTPLGGMWTDDEKKRIETMLHSGEFISEFVGIATNDVNNEVYKIKLYSNDAPTTPIFVRPAPSSSQSLKPQSLSIGQEYKVYVSYVETARKFWIQLQNQENELASLMTDIGVCFAEDLPSTGDIVNPSNGQVCAACFSDDGSFYRGIVRNVHDGRCTVFFVDYGNHEEKSASELFTLPQALTKLPMQAVPCSYRVESPAIEDQLHKLAETDGPTTMKVLSGSSSGYVVEINSIEQTLNPSRGPSQSVQTKTQGKLWQSYSSIIMQLDGIYDVCLSHVDHPGHFYCQLMANAETIDNLMQAIDQVAHNYDKLTNLYAGYPCLAKFSDESWYRGEVVSAEVGKITVAAVDFGFTEVISPSNLRNTDPNFKNQHAQAIRCTIDLNKLEASAWQPGEINKFKALVEKSALVSRVTGKKSFIHQIDLYETENGIERHLNVELQGTSQGATKAVVVQQQKMIPTSKPRTVSLLPPEVSTGSRLTLCFTAIKVPYLYGQLTNIPVEKVAKLQTEMNTYFDKNPGETLLGPVVGSVCCTQYIDGGWYRGMVTSISGSKSEVAFVDFGDSVMKALNDLKVLPSTLCELPQQCILCKIDNLPSSVPQDKLERGLVNKRVDIKLGGKLDGVYPTYGAEILDQQILEQFQERSAPSQAVFKGASSRTFGRPPRDDTVPRMPEAAVNARRPSGDGYVKQDVPVGSTLDVVVTHVKDPSSFQVVLDKNNASLDELMDQIHEYYSNIPPGTDTVDYPKLGQPCVAQFTEDKGWYRATITGLKTDGMTEVRYVDYGNSEYTDKDALKSIKQQFMSLPAQAVQCSLAGVSSPQGFWSPEHQVQFTEMVEEQPFIATFKSLVSEPGLSGYKVELVDKKGTNINQKFGQMTGTTCSDADSGRSVSAASMGQDMKITVSGDSGWDDNGGSTGFGSKPRSFGGPRQPSGGSGFGARSSGFGSKPASGSSGDSGWDDSGDTSSASSGFGSKKPFGGGSGGFGSRGAGTSTGGFGGSGGGFGSNSSSGFGNSSSGFGNNSSGGGFGGAGGGSKDCFKCGESGHFSRECPNAAKGGGGGGGRDCYKCGEAGHMARDCTNPPKAGGGGGRDCYKCGEGGHMARDCTNPPKAGGSGFGGGGGGSRDCYKCGEGGHMARDCTNPPKAGGGGGFGGGGGASRDCFKCGESGHMSRDCTNPPKAGGGGSRDCYKCGESGHMARDCTNPPKAGGSGFGGGGGGGGRDCYKCGESGHMARDCTNPPKEGAGPRRGFGGGDRSIGGFGGGDRSSGGFGGGDRSSGGFGGGDRSSGGGFGNKGGFKSGSGDGGSSEDWGDGGGNGSSSGGFRSRGGGGGFGSGRGGGGFGSSGGGFGKKSGGDDWGDSGSKPASEGFGASKGGFGGGSKQSGGFGKTAHSDEGGDWGIEEKPAASTTVISAAGDSHSLRHTDKDTVLSSLTLGVRDTVDVYVVYTTNPQLFWCQIIKNCPSLEKLMEEMNSFYNGLPEGELTVAHPQIGMPCAAKFSEDNMWYRAEILTFTQGEVEVQFVDYGNTETVNMGSLRKLKPEFMTLKTQGIRCTLDGVIPTDKKWTDEATAKFEELTRDQHLVARVVNTLSDMTHVLDLEYAEEQVNIGITLCEHGYCVFKDSRSSPVKEQIVKSPYPLATIENGQEIDVYVSWIESPEQFWIQPVSQEDDLVQLVDKIQEMYTSGAGVNLRCESYKSGQAVVGLFSEDGAWYRGYVERRSADKYKVRFTDYGNSDMISQEALRLPTSELLQEASKAAMCKLVGVRPLLAGQWTADARDIMDGLVKEQVVKCKVISVADSHFAVELVSKGVDVKQELIQAAVVRGEKEASPKLVRAPVGVLTYPNQISLTPGSTEAVFVSHTDSVASFWCQLVRTAGELEEVMAQLESHCQSGTNITNFPIDMACGAKFSDDNSWYRAQVTATYPDSVEVYFVDYGNTEKVSKSDICELTEDLVQLPPQAIECELMNASQASNQLTSKFIELTGDQEVQATIIAMQDNSAVVSLTLSSGKVVGEELGLSAPGSTPAAQTRVEPVRATPIQQTPTTTPVLSYPPVVMPTTPTEVFVTQIINAGEFYVQRVDREAQLTELMSQVSEYCKSGSAGTLSSPVVGQACCAVFSDDGEWYRAKVLNVDGDKCSVEFIDFGNWEETTCDNIRTISPEFVTAAPFVLRCQLEGVTPVGGTWTEESVKKFEELAVEKDLVCETVKGTEVILTCGDIDISEALVEAGFAKKLEGSPKRVKPAVTVAFFQTPSLPSGPEEVFVSHVKSPGDFYIQLVNQETNLEALMENISGLYESGTGRAVESVTVGQAVAAKYSEDDAWYRAEVVQVDGDNITVHFVDYGNSEDTSKDDLKVLTKDLVVFPRFAINCYLSGVEPVGSEWSEESIVFFETQSTEKVLKCESLSGNGIKLKLDRVDIADSLVENGYAKRFVEAVGPAQKQAKFATQSVPADSVACYVSHIEDTGLIYLQLACEEDTLNTVVEQVQKLQSHPPLDFGKVCKGDNMCAKFSEDHSWYRANVISTDGTTVEVRFVDYGNCDTVTQACDLRALTEDHLATPPLAYACRLQGLKTLNAAQLDLLKESTADKELTVTFNTVSPEYEVHLLDENQVDLEELVRAGSQEKELVRTGSQEEELVAVQVEEEAITPQIEGSSECEPVANTESEAELSSAPFPEVDLDSMTGSILDLQQEHLEVEQRVKVLVSHADSPSRLFVQLESQKDNLDSLLNTMFDFYTVCEDSRLMVDTVSKDMVVAALYPEDESWYRAKVVKCDNEVDVTVVFIDHGNTEVISKQSLRKLPTQFCQLPVQAIECCLGAVQPSSEAWTEEAKETFTELTADKMLLLDVGGIDDNGVYKVHLLDMGMSISDLLLQRNIGAQVATPVALSTKVKQVFSPDNSEEVITRLYSAKPSETIGKYGYPLRDLAIEDPTISSHNVLVTTINSPLDFWCRLQDNAYDFYQDKLQEKYAEEKEPVSEWDKGTRCVICKDDKEFHRASVINKTEDSVLVKLVDIGCDISVPCSSVFTLKPELGKYPQLAFCCSLAGVTPVDGDQFSVEAVKVFSETVVELSNETELPASAKATVIGEEDGLVLVELTIDRKDISESLVEKGIARLEARDFHEELEKEDEIIGVVQNFGEYKNLQLDFDNDYDVVLIDCSDINRLVMHTRDSLDNLNEIAESIAEIVGDKHGGEGIEEDFECGPCLAKCPEDSLWYRANLRGLEKTDDEVKYQVFLVDYGSSYDLPKANILPIPDSLKVKPGQAVICRLGEIEPIDGQWSDDVFSFFTDQYMGKDVTLVAYVNGCTNGIHEVLLSSRDQEKSVNHLLVEIGLAVPVIGSQVEMSMLAETAETSFNELSMTREDSYGDSTELGDTSYEPDSSYLVDTSCVTDGDTSQLTEGDTTQFTSCLTETDTSCVTESDTSQYTERESSFAGDTSCLTDGNASRFTEAESSYMAESDTSYYTEGNTTGVTGGETSYCTESDTSGLNESESTEVGISSSEIDTSGVNKESETTSTEEDVTKETVSREGEENTSVNTEGEENTSVNTLNRTRWVCVDCSGENLDESMVECQHCHRIRKVVADGTYLVDKKDIVETMDNKIGAEANEQEVDDAAPGSVDSDKEDFEDAPEQDVDDNGDKLNKPADNLDKPADDLDNPAKTEGQDCESGANDDAFFDVEVDIKS